MSVYAGIGSRRAPDETLGLCTRIAWAMADTGWTLRSGHAIGCDQAFERGARAEAEVFLPWPDFESEVPIHTSRVLSMPSVRALEMVEDFHPTPHRLSMASLRLMARNAHILLGPQLCDPVDRIICWTQNLERGGTAATLRLARRRGIQIDNLADPDTYHRYLGVFDRSGSPNPP